MIRQVKMFEDVESLNKWLLAHQDTRFDQFYPVSFFDGESSGFRYFLVYEKK